ncbi:hypothetical protein [Actinoplanes sp. DH11]|uniref:hypothetical protein n=1 Tax=Actinoplanes sp. DH11 TaxID=2857011 RepID=UPI001E2AA497|nr:hypothetical protein [Actinoplanes sp. DH11]
MAYGRKSAMSRWLTGVVSAVVLAFAGVAAGASPAAAATERCGNVNADPSEYVGGTIARVCIYWEGGPSGPSYTTTQVKVWNPAGQGVTGVWSVIRYNDGLSPDYTEGGVADGNTYIKTERHVGAATTAFEIASSQLYYTYCAYVIPTGIETRLGGCR